MRLRFVASVAACLAAASLFVSSDAEACGGCVVPPSTSTVVTGHRMALAVSPTQTVLWDQIQYTGDPADFAWILPVKPGAYIEPSTDAWFETLDAATNVRIVQPSITCEQPFSFGCGAQSDGALRGLSDEAANGGGPAVDILHRGTVGPYQTVTITTDKPGALNEWLTENGYAIDPKTQPVIDAYVAEDFDFIALRLQPDKGVRDMKPVRVISPGASPTLPLRMVAVGTGAEVAVTLFVLAEGRWEAENFPNARVPMDLTAWDFKDGTSNYAELRAQTLGATEGKKGWITTYARQGSFLSPVPSQFGGFFGNVTYATDANFNPLDTIAEAYLNQGILNKETALESGAVDESTCIDAFAQLEQTEAQSGALVEDACPKDAPPDDPTCVAVDPNKTDSRVFGCGALDDLSVAMVGSHPRDMWITRIEAALPQDALKSDLTLRPAESQEAVENWIQARIAVNAEDFCGSLAVPGVPSSKGSGKSAGTGALAIMWLGGLALAAAVARRISKGSFVKGSFS